MLVFYRKAVIIGFTRILTKRDDGEEAMKPNIVFITSDQQRRDSLGIYGCRYVWIAWAARPPCTSIATATPPYVRPAAPA